MGRVLSDESEFCDIFGGCVSTCAIWDASERFMHEEARSNLSQNIYMDDISLLQYFDTPGGCDDLIKEVDRKVFILQLFVWV